MKDGKIYRAEAQLRVNGKDVGTTFEFLQNFPTRVIYGGECAHLDDKVWLMLDTVEFHEDESPYLLAVYCLFTAPY